MAELFDDLVRDYEVRGKATLDFLSHLKPVKEYFSDMRAVDVTEEIIDRFISSCLAEGKSPGTINRETPLLGRALRLAVERKRIAAAPKVRRLPGGVVRSGFFERPEFEAEAHNLPADLQDFARFGYLTGWRKGEIASLQRTDVDIQGRIIRLRGENAKNGEPRKVALEGELWDIVDRRLKAGEVITESGVKINPSLFHRENGSPVKNFRRAWATACKKAGIKKMLFHDLRRTAVRNMVRAGVSESVAMKISGHKTASVF